MMVNTGRRLPTHTQQGVIDHIAAGKNNTQVWQSTGINRNLVAKLRLSLEYWGQCYPPPTVKLGRPPLLRRLQLDALEEYIKGKPTVYLEEMQKFLYEEFDIEASLPTVWRALIKLNYSRKLATK